MIQSLVFWAFLFAAPLVFWLLPSALRLYFVAFASFGLVTYLAPGSGLLLLVLSVLLYLALPQIAAGGRRGSYVFVAALLVTVGTILYFKYIPGIIDGIFSPKASIAAVVVPLGMSYYIFKMIHVTVDAYRRQEFKTDPATFFCWLFLFTTFSAGPIQRLDLFVAQKESAFRSEFITEGLTRIAFGVAKQFFLIDFIVLELRHRIVPHADVMIPLAGHLKFDTGELWLKLLFVYLVGYLNFSAYTDIAIGSSRLFGFRISENFNFPIIARSIVEFWQRWHMTLAAWAQAYVYSPLIGITRNPYISLYASFAVIGLWHAGTLNRLAWGAFHATGVLVVARWSRYARQRKIKVTASPPGQVASWVLTQGFVVASMVFVVGEYENNVLIAGRLLIKLFGIG